MAEVKVNINGKEIVTDDSKTILQVVREHNLDDIPTLCYEERLGQISSCFLCVVEVEGARGLVPSCSTKVRDGMVVRTRTPKVLESRKMCLELLFSNHYADCISPCAQECPAGVDIQGYLSLVKEGLYREAIELIKEKNPLPIVCGRVCVRLCEIACRRNLLDEPVGIDYLKRYAAETREGMKFAPKKKPPRGKSVAIVGAGPAGLTAAYYLAIEGYDVTIYEAMPKPGGMLRYGIPAYRLPRELLDLEIKSIEDLGVKILCNKALGKDFTLTDLKERYDAVLLTIGAWGAMNMRVEGENAEGVLPGLEVLRKASEGTLKELKGRVLVIGGGNTAIDCARTSVRLGADETVILYRRTEAQMPAHKEEVEAARHEGVKIKFLVSPKRVVTTEQGRAVGLECIKMKLGEPDASGRPRPVPIEGSEYVEPCDWIISAIGQYPITDPLADKIELNRRGRIVVNEETMETNIPGVFSCGDVVTGPATVIEGIAGGRKAAYSIHHKLSGEDVKTGKEFVVRKDMFGEVSPDLVSHFEKVPRRKMPERDPKERIHDFKEVELGLSREDTIIEANRCFQCGCLAVDDCLLRKYGEEYKADPTRFIGDVNIHPVDRRHPFIVLDPNKCILCGRCIKTCEAILDSPALGFVNRGFATKIAPAMEKPLAETNCVSCGNCIDSCPTGAIEENLPLMARIGDKVKDHEAICSFCSVGCHINVRTFGRDMRIKSTRDIFTGEGDYLCRRGRFGSRYLKDKDRMYQPSIRQNGRHYYTDWNKALQEITNKIKEVKDKYGANSVAVLVSPKFTNEEMYAILKLARGIIGTDMVGSFRDLFYGRDRHELDDILGYTVSTNPMEDVYEADVLLLVNTNPYKSHPSFGWRIRDAIRKGTKVIVISSVAIDGVYKADLWLQPRRGTLTYLLNGIMKEIIDKEAYHQDFVKERTKGFETFKKFLKKYGIKEVSEEAGVLEEKIQKAADIITQSNPKVMAVYDFDNYIDRSTSDLKALASLMLITGNIGKKGRGIILLQRHANTVGLYDASLEPGYLVGRKKIEDDEVRNIVEKVWGQKISNISPFANHNIEDIFLSGKIKAALIFGENPLENPSNVKYFRQMDFIATLDLFETETTRYSDVVLPASTVVESGGSFTRMDRKVQFFSPALPPLAGKTNLEVISELIKLMGGKETKTSHTDVFEEIKEVNPLYKGISEKGGFWVFNSDKCDCGYMYCCNFATSDGKAHFVEYPVDARTYSELEYAYNSIEKRYEDWIKHLFLKGKTIPVSI